MKAASPKKDSTVHLGFEAKLWLAAVMRGQRSRGLQSVEPPRNGLKPGTTFVPHPDLRSDSLRCQSSGATWTSTGSPEGSRGGANQFGVPPKGSANFARVQYFNHCILRSLGEGGHLAPQGMAGFVLANGSMSSNQSGEGEIRKAIIEADHVDCMVAQ